MMCLPQKVAPPHGTAQGKCPSEKQRDSGWIKFIVLVCYSSAPGKLCRGWGDPRWRDGEEDPPEPPQIRTELRLPGRGLKKAVDIGCQTPSVSRGWGRGEEGS